MNFEKMSKGFLYIALIDIVILILGITGAAGIPNMLGLLSAEEKIQLQDGILGNGHLSFLSLAVGSIAIVTFLGVLRLGLSRDKGHLSEEWIRTTIVISTVTVYLVMVGVFIFMQNLDEPPPLVNTVMGSFTATISVVIAFYFGSTAYIDARKKSDNSNDG